MPRTLVERLGQIVLIRLPRASFVVFPCWQLIIKHRPLTTTLRISHIEMIGRNGRRVA
jgi:hypothetical protein